MIHHIRDLHDVDPGDKPFLVLDTNILIQILDPSHQHHGATVRVFEKLKKRNALRPVYFLATKMELQEYFRRKLLTEFLREGFERDPNFLGGNGELDAHCRNHPRLQATADDFLTDRDIKGIREHCFRNFDGNAGFTKWQNLSSMVLSVRLPQTEKDLANWGIRYINLHDKELFPEGATPPLWQDQMKFMCQYALGSADAAILNMAASAARIHGIVTNDGDFMHIFHDGLRLEINCYTFISWFVGKAS